jgi:hypothetical protein
MQLNLLVISRNNMCTDGFPTFQRLCLHYQGLMSPHIPDDRGRESSKRRRLIPHWHCWSPAKISRWQDVCFSRNIYMSESRQFFICVQKVRKWTIGTLAWANLVVLSVDRNSTDAASNLAGWEITLLSLFRSVRFRHTDNTDVTVETILVWPYIAGSVINASTGDSPLGQAVTSWRLAYGCITATTNC